MEKVSSYFVLKTVSYSSIASSIRQGTTDFLCNPILHTGIWKTPLHKNPPHTHQILNNAFDTVRTNSNTQFTIPRVRK
jgi:hypothetical protein